MQGIVIVEGNSEAKNNKKSMQYKIEIQAVAVLLVVGLIYFNAPYMLDVYLSVIAALALGIYYFFIKK